MSHEVETMAYANEVPWHGLGARVDDNLSAAEMLKAAGLDWEVRKLPCYAEDPDNPGVRFPVNKSALVRSSDNKLLTVTGPGWKPLQNEEMLGFMQKYVAAGGAKLETAGSLRGGRVVWGLAKIEHRFEVRPGDRVEGYLLITSPHEVGKAISVRCTSVRVVCANTMAYAHARDSADYKQSHVKDFNFDEAALAVEAAHETLAAAERRAKTLDKLRLSAEDAVRKVFVPTFCPEILEDEEAMEGVMDFESQPVVVEELLNSYHNAPGALPGTGWGALNAVTFWADHMAGRDRESRMSSSWVGANAVRKQKAETLLMELAEA